MYKSIGEFECGYWGLKSYVSSDQSQASLFTLNRPFPSSKKSQFQSEAKCEATDMKMIVNYDASKTHFHNKGFALSLVLNVRLLGTRKWPIDFLVGLLPLWFYISMEKNYTLGSSRLLQIIL